MRHRLALFGLAMITLLMLACVFGPHLLPYDSALHRLAGPLCAPYDRLPLSWHRSARTRLGGTTVNGGTNSLMVGFFAMLLSTVIGTLVGVIAGYRGGWMGSVADAYGRWLPVLSVDLPAAGAGCSIEAQPLHDHGYHRAHQLDGSGPHRRGRGPLASRARFRLRPVGCLG